MKKKTITWIKIIAFVIYLAIVIGIEFAYRKPLFDYSISFENDIQTKASKSTMAFYKAITHFGSIEVLIPLGCIIFFFFSLNKAYTFIAVLVLSVYLDNILKISYGSPRPFWFDQKIHKACDGGFGNPSGHSFTSSASYLTAWHIITSFEWFKKNVYTIILRFFLLAVFVLLICLIVVSRLYLGVHGINQVVYGATLGVALYFTYFFLLELHKMNGKAFQQHLLQKQNIVIYAIVYSVFFIVVLLLYLLRKNNETNFIGNLMLLCPDLKKYRKFNEDGFYAGLTLFFLIGLHYGLMIMFYWLNKHYPNTADAMNNWHYIKKHINALYRVLLFIPFLIVMILYLVIPSKSAFAVLYIFKMAFPYLSTGLLIVSGYLIVAVKCKIVNEEVWMEETNNLSSINIKQEDIELNNHQGMSLPIKKTEDNQPPSHSNINSNHNNNSNEQQVVILKQRRE